FVDVSKQVTNYEIAPDGSRALFGARGDVFTVPVKHGNTRNLTQTPGVHERNSKWSPDGKWIAYISDATGEDEVYIVPQNGSAPATQVTSGGDNYKYQILWSPDSKKLMWSDRLQRLRIVDIETKRITEVASAEAFEIRQYAWSPDSKWIAYARPEVETMTRVYLYSLDTKSTVAVTDGWYSSYAPAFSSDGTYLFFVSNRSFSPTYSQTEWNHAYLDMAKIYLVTLAKETASPFAPKSDEVKIDEPKKDEKKAPDTKTPMKVDAEGIGSRIAAIPVTAANYRDLGSVGDKLYYIRQGSKDAKAKLFLYELDKQKETELGEVNGYEISADGKKMLVGQDGTYAIIDLPSGKIDIKERLNLSDLKVRLDRRSEWSQIFREAWRQMRDFFYAPNMHGVDWPAMKKKYEPLVAHVNHRVDLTYVIGEMVSELNVGHAYVGGGDFPKPDRVSLGLLGAKVERDVASGLPRITKILRGENWDPSRRSPLTDIGVDVREGDFILAVNGQPTNRMANFYESLVNTAGKQVTLKV
ncbi:MAG: PDZ domain-containing protein, partial [Bacteroidota bacterium]